MVQIVQGRPGYGELFGQGISTGLQGSLQQLAQVKANEYAQQLQAQKNQKALQAFGYSPQQAADYSQLEAPILQQLVKHKLNEPSNQAFAEYINRFTGGGEVPNNQQEEQNSLGQVAGPLGEPGVSSDTGMPKIPPQFTQKQATEALKLQMEKEKLGLKKRQAANEEKKIALGETKKLRHGLEASNKDAKSKLHAINRLEELESEEGGLPTAGYNEFLQNAGLDIPSMLGPQGEEFTKIITSEFQRGAKEIYGGRITNFEMANFIKSIPSLSQSPEGRKRVLANLKYYYGAQRAYNDTKKEIIRENGGVPPLDLDDQIDDRIDPKLDKLSKKFKENLKKEVPQAQNPLITAGQALAGKAVKNIPGAFKGAAKGGLYGAGIGALGGPIGATGGGILGGLGGLLGLI